MSDVLNDLGQPVGFPLPDWRPPPRPAREEALRGRTCRLEPLSPTMHAADLFAANQRDVSGASWTYMPYGPFAAPDAYARWVAGVSGGDDPLFFAIVEQASGKPLGVASYLRINPAMGTIEIGHVHFSPLLQRTVMATEAIALLMQHAFRLGYRRCEWKCDALNAASRKAALRLGFRYEGTFRQAVVYKGRNRDTAWYAVVDQDWPPLHRALQRWLAAGNFDAEGHQRRRLGDCMQDA